MAARKKAAKRRAGKKIGRPSKFTPTLGLEICKRLSIGESVLKMCRDEHMPDEDTVRSWVLGSGIPEQYADAFRRNYEQGRLMQADHYFEEVIELGDDCDEVYHGKARLQTDNRKWVIARMNRAKYGDKQDVSLGGIPGSEPIQTTTNVNLNNLTAADKKAAAKLARAALNKGAK